MFADFLASNWPLILIGIGLYVSGRARPIKRWCEMNHQTEVGVQVGRIQPCKPWPRR